MTPDLIIIHCTATTGDIGARSVDAYHRSLGWIGGGYHAIIRADGTIETGPDPLPLASAGWQAVGEALPIVQTPYLRPWRKPGAHTAGLNDRSWGVAYAGGLDSGGQAADTRTHDQRWAMAHLVRLLMDAIGEADGITGRALGHRDAIRIWGGAAKACPCFDVDDWWERVRPTLATPPDPHLVRRDPISAPHPEPAALRVPNATHRVRPGETLWGIARIYGVDWKRIADLSGTGGRVIHPGQMLTIPRATGSGGEA